MASTACVIGAAGYIGSSVARALRRAGFRVLGVVRSEASAQRAHLQQYEVIPIIGDATDPTTYADALRASEVVVECAAVFTFPQSFEATCHAPPLDGGGKRLYILTTGLPLYESEAKVLAATDQVDPVCVRPGFVFGHSGGYTFEKVLFAPPVTPDAPLEVVRGKKWPWVHVDDLGRAYELIVRAPRAQVAGQIFRVGEIDATTPEAAEVAIKCARAMGRGEVVVKEIAEATGEAFVLNVDMSDFDTTLTRERLGWTPNIPAQDLFDHPDLYFKAFKAWCP